ASKMRFLGSLLSLLLMHWEHEPALGGRRSTCSTAAQNGGESGRRWNAALPRSCRFMKRSHGAVRTYGAVYRFSLADLHQSLLGHASFLWLLFSPEKSLW